ncbi:MAG: ribosome biogenesis GTP-binding protein YihA/YsxC [Sporomusaceae bacterium]|nr:ribosome biogenesis GTP-binding protein YihA/YsxC [Sporomusaceae bacterium]
MCSYRTMAELTPDIIQAEYLASAVRRDQYPDLACPQVAFVGRSNVGKSSLINSLCRRNSLARTSGKPGKTQTLNFYRAIIKLNALDERRELCLVDLPGYGFARAGQASKRQWAKFIEEYLLQAPQLKLVLQLIDIRHPPMASDCASYAWLTAQGLPVRLVATKADKLSRSQLQKQTALIARQLGAAGGIIAHSSLSGAGKAELLQILSDAARE